MRESEEARHCGGGAGHSGGGTEHYEGGAGHCGKGASRWVGGQFDSGYEESGVHVEHPAMTPIWGNKGSPAWLHCRVHDFKG